MEKGVPWGSFFMRFLVISLILWAAHGGTWYNERKRFDREGKWKCGQ